MRRSRSPVQARSSAHEVTPHAPGLNRRRGRSLPIINTSGTAPDYRCMMEALSASVHLRIHKRMEPQNSRAGFMIGLALIAGLVVGALGGYYVGHDIGYEKAVTDSNSATENSSASANALGGVETNPLENVRINPFE